MAKPIADQKLPVRAESLDPSARSSQLQGAGGMDLHDFIFVLRTRLGWILGCTLLGVVAAVFVTLSMTPVYKAKATLFIGVESSQDTAYARGQFALQRVPSYPQLINDPALINRVIRDLDLEQGFQEVKSSLSATNPTDTVQISVTATDSDAKRSAAVANKAALLLADSIGRLENGDPKKLSVNAELSVPAAPPQFATTPRKSVNLALGLVSGVSLGLLAALMVNKLDPRILRARDLERKLSLRVLGTVEPLPVNGARNKRQRAELGYRQLVSNLLMANDGHLPQRILVLSTRQDTVVDGEQLAQTLAALGKRAVIVQGDAAAAPMPIDETRTTGLAQVLAEGNTLDEALVRIDAVPMGYLPAGAAHETLRKFDVFSGLESVIGALEAEFDVVVSVASIGGAPLDAAVAALHSDCILMTCQERRTTYRQVNRALRELNAVRVGATGLVILKKPRFWQR